MTIFAIVVIPKQGLFIHFCRVFKIYNHYHNWAHLKKRWLLWPGWLYYLTRSTFWGVCDELFLWPVYLLKNNVVMYVYRPVLMEGEMFIYEYFSYFTFIDKIIIHLFHQYAQLPIKYKEICFRDQTGRWLLVFNI